jgi:hypothetical protein
MPESRERLSADRRLRTPGLTKPDEALSLCAAAGISGESSTRRAWVGFGDRFGVNRSPTRGCCQARSKRPRFMTLSHAATKAWTNVSFPSSDA